MCPPSIRMHSSQVPQTSTYGFLIEIHLFHTLGSSWPFRQLDPSLAFLPIPSGFLNIFLIYVIILLIMNLPKSRQSLVSYHPFLWLLSFSLFFDLPQPTFKSSSYFRHLCQYSVLLRHSGSHHYHFLPTPFPSAHLVPSHFPHRNLIQLLIIFRITFF